jgi:hypothetical protein
MFLVEPHSGQRSHYSSAQALGAAIRRGELGPQARIFHQASNQWLPITVHPEYRRAESDWEQGSIHRLRTRGWTFFPDQPMENDPLSAIAASPEQPPRQAPVLIPGDEQQSWLGSAVRHLLHRARPST